MKRHFGLLAREGRVDAVAWLDGLGLGEWGQGLSGLFSSLSWKDAAGRTAGAQMQWLRRSRSAARTLGALRPCIRWVAIDPNHDAGIRIVNQAPSGGP